MLSFKSTLRRKICLLDAFGELTAELEGAESDSFLVILAIISSASFRQDLYASSEQRFCSSDRVTLISWRAADKFRSRVCKALSAGAIIPNINLASKALQQNDFFG